MIIRASESEMKTGLSSQKKNAGRTILLAFLAVGLISVVVISAAMNLRVKAEEKKYREGFSIREISDDLFDRMRSGNTYKADGIVPKEEVIEPATGAAYLDRNAVFDYKIEKDDLCYKLFIEKGFEWGGDWTDRKDYQHFELPSSITEKYSEMYSGK